MGSEQARALATAGEAQVGATGGLGPAQRVDAALETLFPGYFAMVMATGIVSIGAQRVGFHQLALALFYLNNVLYAVLWSLLLVRIGRFPRRILADLGDINRAPGFLTMVAGTAILGNQYVRLGETKGVAPALFFAAAALWLLILYGLLSRMAFGREGRPFEKRVAGSWLLLTVSTQSLAVLAVLAVDQLPLPTATSLLLALVMFLLGGFLYLMVILMIFRYFMIGPVTPESFSPDFWITMGACAITTLAGSLIVQNVHLDPVLTRLAPFLEGFTLFFWTTGSFWVPLLLVGGVWRHLVRRFPLAYEPRYWSLVFPLGMYAASTLELAKATALPLTGLAHGFFYAGLTAWTLTFLGVLLAVARVLRGTRRGPGT